MQIAEFTPLSTLRSFDITRVKQMPAPKSPHIEFPVIIDLISHFVALANLHSHKPSWVLDSSTSTDVSTMAEAVFLRPIDRLGEVPLSLLVRLDFKVAARAAMLRPTRPFSWVAPRACATSAKLTAR